jgi:hypothetical protein
MGQAWASRKRAKGGAKSGAKSGKCGAGFGIASKNFRIAVPSWRRVADFLPIRNTGLIGAF